VSHPSPVHFQQKHHEINLFIWETRHPAPDHVSMCHTHDTGA